MAKASDRAACGECGRLFSLNGLPSHERTCGLSCSVPGCDGPYRSKGYCNRHYHRWRKHGNPLVTFRPRADERPPCSIEECDAEAGAKGLCRKHYYRQWKHGDPSIRLRPEYGPVCTVDECDNPHDSKGLCANHYSSEWAKSNRDRRRETIRRWKARHRDTYLAASRRGSMRRRARMRAAPVVDFSEDQLQARLSMFSGCWMCGGEATAIDHVKPLSAGGWHALSNLRPACKPCNSAKQDTWPLEVAHGRD